MKKKWSRTNRQSDRKMTFWLRWSERLLRSVLWAKPSRGWSRPGDNGRWGRAGTHRSMPKATTRTQAAAADKTGGREGTLRQVWAVIYVLAGPLLATSRKLSLGGSKNKNRISYRPCKKQGRYGWWGWAAGCALGQGRSSGKRNTHSWALAIF